MLIELSTANLVIWACVGLIWAWNGLRYHVHSSRRYKMEMEHAKRMEQIDEEMRSFFVERMNRHKETRGTIQ